MGAAHGETCDDGNALDGEGCNSNCVGAMPGWSCTAGSTISPSVCTPICGDGKVVKTEICDDGNALDGKGCLANCTGVMVGW